MGAEPPKQDGTHGVQVDRKQDRREREAAALRANLQRRKAQARGRRSAVEAAPELPPSGTNEDAQGGEDGAD